MKLSAFEETHAWMNAAGYPKIDVESGYRVIRQDFALAYRNGQIAFEKDGIYLEYEGRKHRGYMFLREYFIEQYPGKGPRFHLLKCETIQQFINDGSFKQRYIWSNAERNTVVDRASKREHHDELLSICGYCSNAIRSEIGTTEDFAAIMEAINPKPIEVEVDIKGYVRGWQRISRIAREVAGYRCAACDIQMVNKLHQKYIQVHHLNGNKLDNLAENLQCLCIYCHSKVDQRHLDNFGVGVNARELEEFLGKYPR